MDETAADEAAADETAADDAAAGEAAADETAVDETADGEAAAGGMTDVELRVSGADAASLLLSITYGSSATVYGVLVVAALALIIGVIAAACVYSALGLTPSRD